MTARGTAGGKASRVTPTRNLYVIRLDPRVLLVKRFRDRNPDHRPGKPCVYVGQTGLTPQERFEQHKRGHKANPYVKKYGQRLHAWSMRRLQPVPAAEAEAAERGLAERLRRRGYAVWQN